MLSTDNDFGRIVGHCALQLWSERISPDSTRATDGRLGRKLHNRTTCGSARKSDGVTNTIRLAMTMVPARK